MDFGVAYFPTHDAMGPGDLARLAEEYGQESLWFAEHPHIPASRETPFPSGGEMPTKYLHTYDPFVALTAAAVATTKLRVGTAICLIVQRDPIITAKEVASIDHLSGGRFEFGVGAGWNREEMRNHGTDPRQRMAIMRERVEAIKEIWTQEEATYEGKHVSFERIWSFPKPAQWPHPPVLIGGHGPTVEDRVLDFADGWLPQYGRVELDRITALQERADRPLQISVMNMVPDPDVISEVAAVRPRRAILWLPSGNRSVVEPQLERWALAIARFNGEAARA